ncbi:MAG: hypothetical protein ABIX28_06335 [Vicinamibacterales bacterium]
MSSERQHWTRVKEIFHEALKRPAERRAEFVARASDGDVALAAEVEAVLASHAETASAGSAPRARDPLPDAAAPPVAYADRLRDMEARIEIEKARGGRDDPRSRSAVLPSTQRGHALTWTLAVLLIAGTLAWLFRPSTPPPELRVVDIVTPGTSDPWSFALAPDGHSVAFVADHDGQPMLWVRTLDSARARVLPGTGAARRPFWSPDGRSIGFFANGELKRIEANGDSLQQVIYAVGGTTAAWGPDDTILYSAAAPLALRRVHASGGAIETAVNPDEESTGLRHPQFLPDGKHFLFFSGGPERVRGVYVGVLGSLESTRLVESDTQGVYVAPGWLIYGRHGALLAQGVDIERRTLTGDMVTVVDSVATDPATGSAAYGATSTGVLIYRDARGLGSADVDAIGSPLTLLLNWKPQ